MKARYDEPMVPTFPQDNILCKNCLNRIGGIIGYKNGYCEAYVEGKPDSILFDNNECRYYIKG